MKQQARVMSSQYMQWAKGHAHVKYNLANSGLTNYPLSDLPLKLDDIELTGNSYYGYEPLLEAIAKRYNVATNKIFSTLGTSFANYMVMAVLYEPDAEILIEQPTYELLKSTAEYVGYKINRFQRRFENKFQIDLDEIKKTITSKTKLIVLTNLHNPSSVFTSDDTLKEIGRIAQSIGAYVLVDEVYLDSAFSLSPRSSIHLGDEFIVTNSLTKVYGLSGLRCGWVFAMPELIQKMWHLNDLFYVVQQHPAEILSVIAMNNLERITAWSRSILENNHQTINNFIQSRTELETIRPGYGTVIFPRLKRGSIEPLLKLLYDKYQTVITPGRFFDMPEFFRIGLGLNPESFKTGIENLSKAIDELSGK